MRFIGKAAVASLALLLGWPGAASAQDATTQAPTTQPYTPIPKKPIPYTALVKKRPPAKPSPGAVTGTAAATAKPAAAKTTALTPVPAPPATPSGARLAPGAPLPPAELEAFVDGVVKEAMARDHIAGAAVSVVQNGQVLLNKGYGFASLEPQRKVDPDRTLFRIGSISKTFTWIALMKEVEAGHIRLDAKLNLFLAERLQIRDQGFHDPVRVVQLMDHSAGFEDRALGHLFENRWRRERPLADYLRQERPRRTHAPGEISTYSNYGAALAGEAVSEVANIPFERLIEERITVPLGLAHTTFRERRPVVPGLPGPMPTALAADIADGYRWTPRGFRARPYEYIGHIAPAGSASSTAGDMARYMTLLLNGGTLDGVTIYGPRTAQAFRTPLRQTPPGVNGWAHGFMIYNLPGGRRGYGHPGATLSFMSNMVVAPDLGLGVFVTTNTETGENLAARLPDQIVQQFYAQPQVFPRPGSPGLLDRKALYQGYYIGTRRAYGGLESFVDLLVSGVSVQVTPEGRLLTRSHDAVQTWVPEGDPAQGAFVATTGDQRLAFSIAGGHAVAMQPASNEQLFERAPVWKQPVVLAILAGVAALAALATLGGVLLRNRREFRETSIQSRISLVQNTQAALWLTAIVLFLIWAGKTGDTAKVMYGWPGPFLVIASACSLVAAALTALTLVAIPAIWRGGRRVDSWTSLRKLAFSLTVLIYGAFSAVLFVWGALSPWSG
jgi:CubicO group peptidase (beta-lactamase class C family)